MKKFIIIMMFLSVLSIFANKKENDFQQKSECYSCHFDNEALPEDFTKYDVHYQFGLVCSDCHGGNPKEVDEEISMSKAEGFIGIPQKKAIPNLCGKCHSNIEYMKKYRPRIETDQVARYYTSKHGQQLKKGDENVAVCTSCHSAHGILPASDPRATTYALNVPQQCNECHGDNNLMTKYDIESTVYDDFAEGVHGIALLDKKDIGAPSCNDCHGNHGATPPGVHSIANVCGICHVNNSNYFKKSKMGEAFDEMEFHGCVECHNNHKIHKPNDNMVGVGEGSLCINCHDKGDEGYAEAEKIHMKLSGLTKVYDSAKVILEEVNKKGMDDVDIEFLLKDSHQSLIQARTLVHTFNFLEVSKKANEGIEASRKAISKSNEELNDYQVRRNGFGAATLAITILIIAVYFKSRELNKKNA